MTMQTTRKSQPVRAGKEEKQGKGHGYPKSCTCWCGCKSAAEGDSGKCKYCKEKKCHEKKKA